MLTCLKNNAHVIHTLQANTIVTHLSIVGYFWAVRASTFDRHVNIFHVFLIHVCLTMSVHEWSSIRISDCDLHHVHSLRHTAQHTHIETTSTLSSHLALTSVETHDTILSYILQCVVPFATRMFDRVCLCKHVFFQMPPSPGGFAVTPTGRH